MAWIVAIIGSIAGFLFGYDEGIIAGSIDLVKNHFNLSTTHIGVMASALPFGALFGSMLIGAFMATKTFNFEKSISELETLVENMEDDKLSLEQSLKNFEKGIQLTQQCQKALHDAEQKVKILINKNGQNELADFTDDD